MADAKGSAQKPASHPDAPRVEGDWLVSEQQNARNPGRAIALSPRWIKVLRDIWINKPRTLLVVLSIAVGVFAVGAIAGTQAVMTREVQRVYAASRASSAILYSTFDDDFVKAARTMSGVADAEGRSQVVVRARTGAGLQSLALIAVHDFNDMHIDKIFPVAGAWPPAKRELLIERSASGPLQASIGSTITVELPDGKTRELRVTGLTYDFQSPPPVLGDMSYGYITLDTLEWLGFPRTYNQLSIVVSQDGLNRLHIQDVADLVKSKAEKEQARSVSSMRIPDPGKPVLDSAVQALLVILSVLGALTLLTTGFLIVNVIAALMAQQVRQIGVMKSFGARGHQIVGMYLGLVLALAVLGVLVGVPLGALGAQLLVRYAAGLLNVELANLNIPVQVLSLQVAVGLVVPVVASLYPVLNGARISVHDAVNNYGVSMQGRFGEHVLDRIITRLQASWPLRQVSRPLLLSLRNTFRSKGRLAFTLATLTLGGAIFIAVFCVRTALYQTMSDSLQYWNYNVVATTSRSHPVELLQREALGVPGVTQAEAWGDDSAVRVNADGSESRSFRVVAPPAGSTLLKPILVAGRWLTADDMNALVINTDMLTDHPDLKVGDQVQLKLNDHKTDWQVVGIVRSVLSGRIAYMSYAEYARAAHLTGRANSVVVVTDQGDAETETRVAKDLEAHFKLAGMQTSSTTTTTSDRTTQEFQFGLLITFLALMAILLAIVGGLGLTGTMSINVLERIREIGVMRAIGASDRAVMGIIVIEGMFIGVISWLFGVILAIPIAHFLDVAVGGTMLHTQITDVFSFPGALLWLVVAVVISALASFLPALRAARLSVREVLSYE
jgi:putative ABC transport system permease protein